VILSLCSAVFMTAFDVGIICTLLSLLAGGIVLLLKWKPTKQLLYLYAALAWLLPRLYPPGLDRILPVHAMVLGALAVLWASDCAKRPRGERLPPFLALVLVYSVCGFVAFLVGMRDLDTIKGIKFLAEACVVGPLLYLLVWSYLGEGTERERFMLVLGASFAVLGLLAYLLRGSSIWTPTVFQDGRQRLSGQYEYGSLYVAVSPVSLSTQMSMLIPAALGIALNSESPRYRQLATALLFTFTLLILLAAGRAGWLGSFVGCAVVLFFSVRSGRASLSRVTLVFAIAVLFALLVLSLGVLNEEIERRLLSLGSLLDDRSVVVRYPLWDLGLELIRRYPLGIGFQAFNAIAGVSTHNQYILWALGTGVIGGAVIVLLLLAWMVRSARYLLVGRDPVPVAAVCALGGVVGALVSLSGDNISTSVGWTQTTLWILLALGASVPAPRNDVQNDTQ